ncbi:Catabolite control protein A [Caldisalinibacter kiritimatiensis]|uniref:Catabolite control protein A n=2 Tax=Caldisalinibacter kiritimatiensis TaxID=1304284 RepID=R1AWU0_9FIRM|nr:Catabolite control protein A [Caldisalinibacter kiritimatiensis]
MVTIKDVAKLAGVSISTVSRVINNSKPVSPEVRKKVLKVIEETGYRPNDIARTLVTKKSYLIGVIVTNLANSYVAEMVRGIEEVGKMYNYDILLCSTYGDKSTELKYIQLLNRKQVEGIIFISDKLNEEVKEQVDAFKIPFLYLSRHSIEEKYPTVTIDNNLASYEMTQYLINLGHKKVAYLTDSEEPTNLEQLKINGYKKAIEENEIEKELIYYANGRKNEEGYAAAKEILKENEDVTAIFCSNDELAIGVINYLRDKDIKVPDEISVAGYGDLRMATIIRPQITTVKEPFYDMGAVAIRMIIKEIAGEKVKEKRVNLPFHIEKRDSCKKIK